MPGFDDIRLLTDAKGRLLVLGIRQGRTAHETDWSALMTCGHRDLHAFRGNCVHDGVDGREAQVRRMVSDIAGGELVPAPPERSAMGTLFLGGTPGGTQGGGRGPTGSHVWSYRGMTFTDDPRHADGTLAEITNDLLYEPLRMPSMDEGPDLAERFRAVFREVVGEAAARLAQLGYRPGVANVVDEKMGAGAVDLFAARYPCLAGYLVAGTPGLGHVLDGAPHPGAYMIGKVGQDDIALAALTAAEQTLGWAVSSGGEERAPAIRILLSRLEGTCIPWACTAGAILGARYVPLDWLPRDGREARAFGICALHAMILQADSFGELDARTMLAASRGRWSDFRRRLSSEESWADDTVDGAWGRDAVVWGEPDPSGLRRSKDTAHEVVDMASRLSAQAVHPHRALAGRLGVACPTSTRDTPMGVAWRLLAGGKGLPTVLSASREWHARREAMDRTIRTIADDRTWQRPFPDFVASNGLVVAPILDAAGLAEEGVRLRHCVAGYAAACTEGTAAIASVRPPGPPAEGVGSTVEFTWVANPAARSREGWRPFVRQHRSYLNRDPSQAEQAAVAETLAWLSSGRAWREEGRPSPRWRSPAWLVAAYVAGAEARHGLAAPRDDAFVPDTLARECGYDWRDPDQVLVAVGAWGPFLPRHARDSLAGFAAAAGIQGWPGDVRDLPAVGVSDAGNGPSLAARLGRAISHDGRRAAAKASRWIRRQNDFIIATALLCSVVVAFMVVLSLFLSMQGPRQGDPTPVAQAEGSPAAGR